MILVRGCEPAPRPTGQQDALHRAPPVRFTARSVVGGPGGAQDAYSVRTASEKSGQASAAQGPNGRSASTTQAIPAAGSTQTKDPLCPKCPKVPRRVAPPGPVRRLGLAQLEPEAPVAGVVVPEARQDAGQAREDNPGRARERLGRDEFRAEQLPGEGHAVGEGRRRPRRRRPGESGRAHAEWREDGRREVVGERHPGGSLEVAGEHLETGARVEAPDAGRRQHPGGVVGRQSRGVRQQVGNRRSRRPRRVVERDGVLLAADEDGVAGEKLRHRGEGEGMLYLAEPVDDAAGVDDRRGGVRGTPARDRLECRHVAEANGPGAGSDVEESPDGDERTNDADERPEQHNDEVGEDEIA